MGRCLVEQIEQRLGDVREGLTESRSELAEVLAEALTELAPVFSLVLADLTPMLSLALAEFRPQLALTLAELGPMATPALALVFPGLTIPVLFTIATSARVMARESVAEAFPLPTEVLPAAPRDLPRASGVFPQPLADLCSAFTELLPTFGLAVKS